MASAQAAVLNAVREPLSVEPLAVRDPRDGEVLVRLGASGVCHERLDRERLADGVQDGGLGARHGGGTSLGVANNYGGSTLGGKRSVQA